jgi:hypothetical protein
MKRGWVPREATILSKAATVASASMEWSTTSASDCRVNSSTTWRILMTRPVAVTSNW